MSKKQDARYLRAFAKARELYGSPLGRGASRTTFRVSKRYVIKIPHNEYLDGMEDGIEDNRWEAKICRSRAKKYDFPKAKCWLEYNKELRVTVLRMEYVKTIREAERWVYPPLGRGRRKLPRWTYRLDGYQAGYLPSGKLVAYDYADQRWD